MKTDIREKLEFEPFDREYTLEELLPLDLLATLGHQTAVLFSSLWSVCTESGNIHFEHGRWSADLQQELKDRISQYIQSGDTTTHRDDGHRLQVFPLTYELEIKGYLAISGPDSSISPSVQTGSAISSLLLQFMRLKHQTLLTSNLHGAVVEDAYESLKKKATQLAQSEEKYRHLAANLEIEVQRKTEEIRKAHAHLMQQEKMAAIGQLSAGMAHEINNPLGFIISNLTTLEQYVGDISALIGGYRRLAQLCRDNFDDGPSIIQDQCQEIENLDKELDSAFLLADMPQLTEESITGAKRIQKIVQDLKSVARPGEKGKQLINLHENIEAVLTVVQNRIGPNVTVNKMYGPIPLVPGHPEQISQIWINLILNALDAMAGEGELAINTQAVRNHVMVTISDTGDGIAPEHMPHLFDPFFTTKKVGHGMGLGLHLVYDLIAKHQGRIEVKSEPGYGSSFIVTLPINKEN